MKSLIGILLAIVIGLILGFFGVLNSVFSDGVLSERIIFIAIILVIYCVLSALWGYFLPKYSWQWGLFFSFPGAFFLAVFFLLGSLNASAFDYYSSLVIVYLILLTSLSCLAAYGGSLIRIRMKNDRKIT